MFLCANRLRFGTFIVISISLAGCAAYDPAPYVPQTTWSYTSTTTSSELLSEAKEFQTLSDDYGAERDAIMREQLEFDAPIIGLAAASFVSGVFHGAATATLALGIGSGSFAAAKLYFSPQSRAALYNAASLSMNCAGAVAEDMAAKSDLANETGNADLLEDMQSQFTYTDQELLTVAAANPTDRAALIAARTSAAKSYDALTAALNTLNAATTQLSIFANAVIRGTTSKAFSGVQNTDAALAAIKALQPTGTTGTTGTKPSQGVRAFFARPSISDAEEAQALLQLSLSADALSSATATSWSALQACALPAS